MDINKNQYPYKATIEVAGHTESDLALALREAAKQIEDGYVEGFNSNNTGRYSFVAEGSPVSVFVVVTSDGCEDQTQSYDEALELAGDEGSVTALDEGGEELFRIGHKDD